MNEYALLSHSTHTLATYNKKGTIFHVHDFQKLEYRVQAYVCISSRSVSQSMLLQRRNRPSTAHHTRLVPLLGGSLCRPPKPPEAIDMVMMQETPKDPWRSFRPAETVYEHQSLPPLLSHPFGAYVNLGEKITFHRYRNRNFAQNVSEPVLEFSTEQERGNIWDFVQQPLAQPLCRSDERATREIAIEEIIIEKGPREKAVEVGWWSFIVVLDIIKIGKRGGRGPINDARCPWLTVTFTRSHYPRRANPSSMFRTRA